MASVIKSEPDWSLLPTSSSALRRLLERCLEKEPKRRLRDVGDARVELDDAERAPAVVEESPRASWRRTLFVAALCSGIVAIVTMFAVVRSMSMSGPRGGVNRFQVGVSSVSPPMLALSPDGRTLVMAFTQRGAYLRRLDSWDVEMLSIEGSVRYPFFSPDGEWLSFVSNLDDGLYKARLDGGSVVRVSDLPAVSAESSWTENGTILIGAAGGLWEVSESGGELRQLFSLPEGEAACAPHMLPGGEDLLFQHVGYGGDFVAIYETRSGEITTLTAGVNPRYLDTGHIVYTVGTTLMGARFDVASLTMQGEPSALVEGIWTANSQQLNRFSTYARFTTSRTGTLVYAPDTFRSLGSSLVFVDPGRVAEAHPIPGAARTTRDLRISPDGARLAAHNAADENDVWIYEIERGTASRLTTDLQEDETPVWSPDSRFVAFAGQRGETRTIFRARADGSEAAEILWETESHAHVHDWSPDGRWLVLDVNVRPSRDLWLFDLEGSGDARPLLESRFDEELARVSPDGRYIAYVSNESGGKEVYVQRFPDLGEKRPVSNGGGTEPVWARDGRRLFYRSPTHMMSVDVTLGSSLELSAPAQVFEDSFHTLGDAHSYYDVAPDGRFVMLESGVETQRFVNVVVNWSEELEQRLPR